MTPRSRTTILLLLVLAMLSISSADRADTPGLAESRAASDAFDLVSSDAAAVVLIPDLKRAGDELAAWLDASEQAHVLFGDRPVEQILDVLGLRVGVDEGAPAAILWMTADPGASPVFLVPVTDPRDYLESNYDPHPDGPADAWIHATGEVVHARSLEGHVVISEEAELARTYAPAAGMREKLLELFGTEATRRAAAGEFIAYADGSALRAFRAISNRRAAASAPLDQADGGENAETSDSGVPALLRGARATLLVANVHPLGLGLSSFIAYEPGSILGRLTAGGEGAAASMSRLPDVPFFLAASADIEGLGGGAVLRLLSGGAFDWPVQLTYDGQTVNGLRLRLGLLVAHRRLLAHGLLLRLRFAMAGHPVDQRIDPETGLVTLGRAGLLLLRFGGGGLLVRLAAPRIARSLSSTPSEPTSSHSITRAPPSRQRRSGRKPLARSGASRSTPTGWISNSSPGRRASA